MSSFIYDSIGFTEATVTDGYYDPVPYLFTSSNTVTNEHRANDMSIGSAITSYVGSGGDTDTLRFDLGTEKSANVIALYFSASESADMELSAGSSATDMAAVKSTMTSNFSAGWNVVTFGSTSNQYWFLRAGGTVDNLTEVIIGTKYDFDVNFDLNNKIGEKFGTDIITSYGGQEYANKRHAPKTTWSWNWSYMLASHKTALDGLNSSVQDWKKFIYYDDSNYHYVRMTKPMDFTEVAPSVYSTSVSLQEQLA